MASLGSSEKHKKKLPILSKFFQKLEENGALPKLFYEATIALTPKLHKDTIKNKNYIQISLMNNIHKLFSKILTNQTQQHIKRVICSEQIRFITWSQG